MKRKTFTLLNEEKIKENKTKNEKNSLDVTTLILKEYDTQNNQRSNEFAKVNKNSNNSFQNLWEERKTVLIKVFRDFQASRKILSFDLDDTLITPTVGKFSSTDKDWKFAYDLETIQNKMQKYIKLDYSICIFSNQKGINTGQTQKEMWKTKVDLVLEKLGVSLMIFAALDNNYYRKPAIGMFELFEENYNNNIIIDRKQSIFIGDAAGRILNSFKNKKKQKDFSSSDLKFACNCGFQFQTPEQFFLDDKNQIIPPLELNLNQLVRNNNDHIKYENTKTEIIIMIGSPGSGKSTFTETFLTPKGYVRINQDILKSKKKCLQIAEATLSKKKSCVIDSTNPRKENRKEYITLGKKYSAHIRCFIMNISKELAFHLNNLRNINTERRHFSLSVNDIPIHTFFKYYEEPTVNEGIDEIVQVNFIPGPFINEKDKKIFYMYS